MTTTTTAQIYCTNCSANLTGRACIHEVGTNRHFCNDSCYAAADRSQKKGATGQWDWKKGLAKKPKNDKYAIKGGTKR